MTDFIPRIGPATVLDVTAESDAGTGSTWPHALIRVAFPSFADGRGFTLAKQLRAMGYDRAALRAHGHVLADQYAMARRSGL